MAQANHSICDELAGSNARLTISRGSRDCSCDRHALYLVGTAGVRRRPTPHMSSTELEAKHAPHTGQTESTLAPAHLPACLPL